MERKMVKKYFSIKHKRVVSKSKLRLFQSQPSFLMSLRCQIPCAASCPFCSRRYSQLCHEGGANSANFLVLSPSLSQSSGRYLSVNPTGLIVHRSAYLSMRPMIYRLQRVSKRSRKCEDRVVENTRESARVAF